MEGCARGARWSGWVTYIYIYTHTHTHIYIYTYIASTSATASLTRSVSSSMRSVIWASWRASARGAGWVIYHYMYIYIYVYIHTCKYINIYMCTYIYIYIQAERRLASWRASREMQGRLWVSNVYIYTHTHTHTYIYIYIYIYIASASATASLTRSVSSARRRAVWESWRASARGGQGE